ncbi:hypothetical protein [Diplocloster hominis]|uniref:type II secretion system F family protein n=1 Tax=Diplocloster hominis TaxID=3079010 RepID=UPI0031BBCC42
MIKEISFCLRILLLPLLFASFTNLHDFLKEQRLVERALLEFYRLSEEQEEGRRREETKRWFEEGAGRRKSVLYRFDLMILQSNIRYYLPFLNTEIFLVLMMTASVAAAALAKSLSGIWVLTIPAAAFTMFLFYLVIYSLSVSNYKKTQNSITQFANLLENFSETSDDLIFIFEKVCPYLDVPLRPALQECVSTARNTGNVEEALRNLELQIEHPQFRNLIRNLEICSRHEANYAEIIRDNRRSLQEYLQDQKERKALYDNGRIEISIILLLCLVVTSMLNGFIRHGFLYVLFHSVIGNGIALYCMIVLLACLYSMFFAGKKGQS